MTKEKYVKIMPDYLSNGVWDKGGVMMSLKDLDLSDDAITRKLIVWNMKWENLSDDYEAAKKFGDISSSTKRMFEEQFARLERKGEEIAQTILHDKKDWEVWYTFDGKNLRQIKDPKPMWKVAKF